MFVIELIHAIICEVVSIILEKGNSMDKNPSYQTIDEYIEQYPEDIQKILKKIRSVIIEAAPEATEKISYQMPTFFLKGNLVHFAAYKNHIGFYPVPSGIEKFKEELSQYKGAKGSVQFPIDKPMPLDLIRRIVLFRVGENRTNAERKATKKA
jgi:uncharacterized protein YdhG (YjbR/CyaY superfamily)